MDNRTHDVFVSYSSRNKDVADAIVAEMEQHGIRCWYAPRDVLTGQEWATAISHAIASVAVMVLVYTDESNNSKQVMNEVALAFNSGKTIVPFRMTNDKMSGELEYYLSRVHWLDAVDEPLMKNIEKLREYVEVILTYPDAAKADHDAADPLEYVKKKKKKRRIITLSVIAAAVVVLIGVSAVYVRDYLNQMDKGLEAFHSQYWDSAGNESAEKCFERAKRRNPDAYYYLGRLSERDYDYKNAVKLYEKGIDEGSNLAGVGLGYLYQQGKGTETDLVKAEELYLEAADSGCTEALFYEALLIKNGLTKDGEEADPARAAEMLEKVKDESEDPYFRGYALASLAGIYRDGTDDFEQDYDKAKEYYDEAVREYPYSEGEVDAQLAVMYYNMGNEVEAQEYSRKSLDFYETAASLGNVRAMNQAGLCYWEGNGAEEDGEKSLNYFTQAAECGSDEAMCNIGLLYELGTSTTAVNYDKAYEWYRKSADAGNAMGMYYIGNMYRRGKYGAVRNEPDYATAILWLEKAAENNYGPAYALLGEMSLDLKGFKDKDDERTLAYYDKGIALGDGESMFGKGYYYVVEYADEPDWPKAYEYIMKGANAGYPSAMLFAGMMYEGGNVPGSDGPDYEEAATWYIRTALCDGVNEPAVGEAMNRLAHMYAEDHLEETEESNARVWFLRGAEEGNAEAMFQAGYYYQRPDSRGYHDYNTAAYWYRKSAEEGNVTAVEYLMKLYANGLVNDSEYGGREGAAELARTLADRGDPDAMALYGTYLYSGLGVERNAEKAEEYLNKAMSEGCTDQGMYRIIGSIYRDRGEYDTAIDYYERSYDEGHDPSVLWEIGYVHCLTGDYEGALQYMADSVKNGFDDYDHRIESLVNDMVMQQAISAERADEFFDSLN